tara:strand:+ start:391 stop:843 length:453 start_codon:yes stop_codon:yes gene_type:complete
MKDQLTFWSEEPPAKVSQWRGCEKDWTIRVATSCSPSLQLLNNIAADGWYGRTCPASCHLTKEKILEPCSERWGKSGMGSHTEFVTLNIGEFHSDADVCSLSDILEIGDVPQRFYLSAKACKGILRRAEKRGKKLPEQLQHALEAVAAVG